MGAAVPALMVVGTLMKMNSDVQAGEQQAGMYSYQMQVASNNAAISAQNAQYETRLGEQQVGLQQQKTAQLIGTQRARFGASGVDPNSGSAARTQGDTAALGEMSNEIIRNNAARRAYAYMTQSGDYQAQALLDTSAAQNAQSQGQQKAWGDLIGGAGGVADKWMQLNPDTSTTPSQTDPNVLVAMDQGFK